MQSTTCFNASHCHTRGAFPANRVAPAIVSVSGPSAYAAAERIALRSPMLRTTCFRIQQLLVVAPDAMHRVSETARVLRLSPRWRVGAQRCHQGLFSRTTMFSPTSPPWTGVPPTIGNLHACGFSAFVVHDSLASPHLFDDSTFACATRMLAAPISVRPPLSSVMPAHLGGKEPRLLANAVAFLARGDHGLHTAGRCCRLHLHKPPNAAVNGPA